MAFKRGAGVDVREERSMFVNDHVYLELTETTEGAWRVSDARVPEEDPLHVVAFIESHDEVLEVVWVRGSIVAPGSFNALEEALDAIDDVLTTGEVNQPSVGTYRGVGI
ncbi:MAG TPA: hypothetical protein VEX12_06225 [Microbacterium sp.]|nr:hypothetical protein [Microbacterium sp.]